MDTDNWV